MRILMLMLFSLAAFGLGATYMVGGTFVEPHLRTVGEPPSGIPFEVVYIQREGGGSIGGWFAAGDDHKAGILLLHGIRSDRRGMLGRARFLHAAGYSVLLIDMQAHGETPGEYITFGYRESSDVHTALAYLESRVSGRPVGIIGASMGGASALLGEAPADVDAIVLEGVYSSIETAVENRLEMRFGKPGRLLAPLLLWQIEPRLGISLNALSPMSVIHRIDAPALIIAGAKDERTRPDESKGLYLRVTSPKRLWLVDGARHEDFHRYSVTEYEARVLDFFRKYLTHP